MTKWLVDMDVGTLDRAKLILGTDTTKDNVNAAERDGARCRGPRARCRAARKRVAAATRDSLTTSSRVSLQDSRRGTGDRTRVGFSARSARDDTSTGDDLLDHLLPVATPVRAERRARELQVLLVRRGQHRGLSIPDLVLAAIADIEQLVVLHYDHGFDLITEVTGQPTEWVVPRGSIA